MAASAEVTRVLGKISALILNPLIKLAFAVALVVFFWGIFQFIKSGTSSDDSRAEGKRKIGYGLLGMFIMISVYGLIRLILGTFDISNPGYIPL